MINDVTTTTVSGVNGIRCAGVVAINENMRMVIITFPTINTHTGIIYYMFTFTFNTSPSQAFTLQNCSLGFLGHFLT